MARKSRFVIFNFLNLVCDFFRNFFVAELLVETYFVKLNELGLIFQGRVGEASKKPSLLLLLFGNVERQLAPRDFLKLASLKIPLVDAFNRGVELSGHLGVFVDYVLDVIWYAVWPHSITVDILRMRRFQSSGDVVKV